ncbi:MAG: lysophospholipid acyltransferase family protein [Gemmatimonadota bacterium]
MRLKARLAGGLTDLVRRAPRWTTEPLALGLGGLLCLTHERRAARENLRRVFPEWPRRRRGRVLVAAYRQMARGVIEFIHTPDYTDEEIRDRVTLRNLEALERAHAEGRGVILLSGHFGNWEWLARRVAAAGYPFAVLFKAPREPVLAARLRSTRAAGGIEQIDHDDMRSALKWLRRGGVLGIVMDQEPRQAADGVVAPLFGQPTMTHTGPFRLARLTGVPVLTFFSRRVGRGRYGSELVPFPLSPVPDAEAAIAEDAAAFNARLEAAVRRDPDHWLWMYRRWGRLARWQQAAAVSA